MGRPWCPVLFSQRELSDDEHAALPLFPAANRGKKEARSRVVVGGKAGFFTARRRPLSVCRRPVYSASAAPRRAARGGEAAEPPLQSALVAMHFLIMPAHDNERDLLVLK